MFVPDWVWWQCCEHGLRKKKTLRLPVWSLWVGTCAWSRGLWSIPRWMSLLVLPWGCSSLAGEMWKTHKHCLGLLRDRTGWCTPVDLKGDQQQQHSGLKNISPPPAETFAPILKVLLLVVRASVYSNITCNSILFILSVSSFRGLWAIPCALSSDILIWHLQHPTISSL